jgi:type II secretory pathway component GspD/PulD (secretin)
VKGDNTPELLRRIEQLEKQIQTLASEVKALQNQRNTSLAQPAVKTEVKTFLIHQAGINEVAQTLWDLYRSKTPSERPSIATNGPTNTLIVVGCPNDLGVIETIVTQLEKLPRQAPNERKVEK